MAEGVFKCDICDRFFASSQGLGGHMRGHYLGGKKKLGKKLGRPKGAKKPKAKKKTAIKPTPQIFEIIPEDSGSDDAVVIPIKIRIIIEVVRE